MTLAISSINLKYRVLAGVHSRSKVFVWNSLVCSTKHQYFIVLSPKLEKEMSSVYNTHPNAGCFPKKNKAAQS